MGSVVRDVYTRGQALPVPLHHLLLTGGLQPELVSAPGPPLLLSPPLPSLSPASTSLSPGRQHHRHHRLHQHHRGPQHTEHRDDLRQCPELPPENMISPAV